MTDRSQIATKTSGSHHGPLQELHHYVVASYRDGDNPRPLIFAAGTDLDMLCVKDSVRTVSIDELLTAIH